MKVLLTRLLILSVILINIQCAAVFLVYPERYVSGFELTGTAGIAAVRGFGVLFLMWNIPYLVAFWDPVKNRVSLYESLAMQAVGLVGETAIYQTIPLFHTMVKASVLRFIQFDTVGLMFLILAILLSRSLYTGKAKQ